MLENTQFALIATVHKLYAMVRAQQAWDLGEPELNDRGQPVIHNIAARLGCLRSGVDLDLPAHNVFPEDEAGLAELARQLEEQQAQQPLPHHHHHHHHHQQHQQPQKHHHHHHQSQALSSSRDGASLPELDTESLGTGGGVSRNSPSDLDHSHMEPEYGSSSSSSGGGGGGGAPGHRRAAFGGVQDRCSPAITLSPQSLTYTDFGDGAPAVPDSASSCGPAAADDFFRGGHSPVAAQPQQPHPPHHHQHEYQHHQQQSPSFPPPAWPKAADYNYMAAAGRSGGGAPAFVHMDLLGQGLCGSNFGSMKPHVLGCVNPEVMLGMADPMIYGGYEAEMMGL